VTIFCVAIPLLACGLLIYFGMKRVFKQIDEAEDKKITTIKRTFDARCPRV